MNDFKYAVRQLAKSPGFTVIAVLSLALGIGANTAIFSLINSMLLKSLPVRNAQELRCIHWTGDTNLNNMTVSGNTRSIPSGGILSNAFSYAAYQEFRDQSTGLSDVFALSLLPRVSVIAKGTARTADGLTVSGNFFQGLGVGPLLGRTISSQDDQPEAVPVVVLSYAGWQEHFRGDPDALGQSVALNGSSYTVIGVLDQEFVSVLGHSRTHFYVPLTSLAQLHPDFPLESPGNWRLQVIARLAPDANERQVCAGLDVLFRRSILPNQLAKEFRPPHILLRDGRRGFADACNKYIQSLFILMAIVGIVLFVACINLAGLLLARGTTREHELAVRKALGARHRHLLRLSLAESLLIALAGVGLGSLLGSWGKTVLARLLLPPNMPLDVGSDMRVFVFTLGVSVLAVGLFGLIPALRTIRADPMISLKDRATLGKSHLRLGGVLVVTQVGLCLLLLMGAGLFTRTLINLQHLETGFNAENLLTFQMNARNAGYEGEHLVDFYEQARERIADLPGVQAAAVSSNQLLDGWRSETMMILPSHPGRHHILIINVSDSFLSTMGIPLIAGRDFSRADNAESARVILVNQTLAQTAFPGEDPMDRILIINQENYRIIGICGDIKYYDLKVAVEPTVLFPYRQHAGGTHAIFFQVRTALEPLSLVSGIRQTLAELDPMILMADIKTQSLQLNESIARERLFASLGSILAFLAILLVCIGLYGLLAYNVARRTGELGIRMALGATPRNVAWPILRGALLMTVAGVTIGVPAVLATVRIVQSYLFGIDPYDPMTLIGAIILLFAVAVMAAWIPARRAAKVDPMEALRYE